MRTFFNLLPRQSLALLALLLFLVAGCGGAAIQPDTAPEIRYGEDICERCGMIVSDERFAAGLVVETAPHEYEHRIFDDIGEMFAYATEQADELNVVSYFVHDYNSKAWIDAQEAYFVVSEELHTPMGFGLAASAQLADAEALAQERKGQVLSFTETRAWVGEHQPGGPMHSSND